MATNADDIKHLKLMIAAAKKEPVNIAVCMGSKPEGAVVLMHKIKNPDALAREAKAAGDTVKVARGTIVIEGTKATLQCADKPPGGVAKHMKAYFKSIDIILTVDLVDATGQPILDAPPPASDPLQQAWLSDWSLAEPRIVKALQTDSPETAKIRAIQGFALAKAEAGQFEAASKSLVTLLAILDAMTEASPSPPPAPGPDRGELAQRASSIKARLGGLDGPLAQKLTEGFVKAVEHLKAGSLEAAADLLTKLETTLAKIEAAKGTGKPASPTPWPPDPKLAQISATEAQLRAKVGAIAAGATQTVLLEILDRAAAALTIGAAEEALAAQKRVQDGLTLQAEVDRLAPLVAKAASSGRVADVNALNLLFNAVADKIPAPDQAKALAALARVEDMIAAGKTMDTSAHDQDQPLEIRPYAEARINWNLTRAKLRSEISRLEAGIAAVLADEGLEGKIKVEGALLGYIEKLDSRLEGKLAEIVSSAAGAGRETLKRDARALIAEYRAELDGDFFADVDDANGFVPVAVASTARTVLNDLSLVLAA